MMADTVTGVSLFTGAGGMDTVNNYCKFITFQNDGQAEVNLCKDNTIKSTLRSPQSALPPPKPVLALLQERSQEFDDN